MQARIFSEGPTEGKSHPSLANITQAAPANFGQTPQTSVNAQVLNRNLPILYGCLHDPIALNAAPKAPLLGVTPRWRSDPAAAPRLSAARTQKVVLGCSARLTVRNLFPTCFPFRFWMTYSVLLMSASSQNA